MGDLGTIVSRSRKDPVERRPSLTAGWRRRRGRKTNLSPTINSWPVVVRPYLYLSASTFKLGILFLGGVSLSSAVLCCAMLCCFSLKKGCVGLASNSCDCFSFLSGNFSSFFLGGRLGISCLFFFLTLVVVECLLFSILIFWGQKYSVPFFPFPVLPWMRAS